MASADDVYVDPSALRSLYVHDDRSAKFCTWRKRLGGSLQVTRFGRAEIVNSIQLGVFRGVLKALDAHGALSDFEVDLAEGRLILVDVLWRRTLDTAADLSARHTATLGTRTLDVLHVATAVTLAMKRFVTYDDRQASLARASDLRVLAP